MGNFSILSYAESSVWQVSKDGKYFYLGGTVHLLRPDDHPLPDEFHIAYKNSDQLIFETDINSANRPEIQQKMLAAMTEPGGAVLSQKVNSKTYRELEQFLAARNIPIQSFTIFHPWSVALTITVIEYQRLGMQPQYGVEEYFNRLALKDNKSVSTLETIEEQLSFLQSMANIDPNVMLSYTLKDLADLPEFIETLKTSWREGDIESFTTHSTIVQMKNEFPNLYNTLITNRNNEWMKDISQLNNNNIVEFVLVGALHLNGKEGLINQLEEAGYSVNQL
jgi:uncharacterized protein YbaP (TraB family)